MAGERPNGEWRRRTLAWYEMPTDHCELCGRPLPGRVWAVSEEAPSVSSAGRTAGCSPAREPARNGRPGSRCFTSASTRAVPSRISSHSTTRPASRRRARAPRPPPTRRGPSSTRSRPPASTGRSRDDRPRHDSRDERALLEQRGAEVIFVTTAGFRDVPIIQRVDKKDPYDLQWEKPRPFVERRTPRGRRESGRGRHSARPLLATEVDPLGEISRLEARDGPVPAVAVSLLFACEPRARGPARRGAAHTLSGTASLRLARDRADLAGVRAREHDDRGCVPEAGRRSAGRPLRAGSCGTRLRRLVFGHQVERRPGRRLRRRRALRR